MNKIFKVIYSKTRHCYVVVSELAKSHCKSTVCPGKSKTALTAAVLLALGTFSFLGMPTAQAEDAINVTNDYIGINTTVYNEKGKKENPSLSNRDKSNSNYAGVWSENPGAITVGVYAGAGQQTVTIGNNNRTHSVGSVYIGEHKDYLKPGNQPKPAYYVTSVGFNADAAGYGSIAIGSNAQATNSDANRGLRVYQMSDEKGNGYGYLENNPTLKGASVALGYSASAADGNVAIGAYSQALMDDEAKKSLKKKSVYTDEEASSYVSVGGTVTTKDASGNSTTSTIRRRISNVADGADATDVATVGQLQALSKELGGYKPGFGIKIDPDSTDTTKNTISLNRNLGTNYGNPWKGEGKVTFEAGGENSLILGGAASILFHNEADDVKAGAYGKDSVLVGGFNNLIDANDDDIYKIQTGEDSVIVGGDTNTVTGKNSVIIGGYKNTVTGSQSVINGGASNEATGAESSVFGGQQNTASGLYASVFGGDQNEASEEWSSAIGGITNTASGIHAVTLGGENNVAKGQKATTVGGSQNMAIGEWSLAAGGAENTSYGDAAYTAGGMHNMAYGNDSVALGGVKSNVNAKASTGIAGGSTGEKAITALAAGYQSVVTDSGVEWHTATQADLDAKNQGLPWSGFTYTEDHDPYTTYVLDKISTAVGYQSTADAPGVIAFGHDKGDVASVAKKWKQKATMEVGDDYSAKFYDANHNEISSDEYYKLANADGTWNDYTQAPIGTEEKTYQSAYYNRLVKAADGIEDHDAVVMEQLKNASDVGSKIKVYQTDENGNIKFDKNNNPIEDTSNSDAVKTKREAAQKASEDAWGEAIGTGHVADPKASNAKDNGSGQLVTGGKVYTEVRPATDGTYVKTKNTTAANLTALDKQVAANTTKLGDKNHNIKYYSVEDKISDDKLLPSISGYSNEKNDGAKGAGSMAAGFNTHADGIASTVAGSYSGVINSKTNGLDLRGATALSYGTFNINQNTDVTKEHSGVANSIIGQANATTDSNAAIIYGAGNTVTNSYRAIDTSKFDLGKVEQDIAKKDAAAVAKDLQEAVPTSGGQVMVMGGGNNVESAYMTQVVGVGNTVKGNQVYAKNAKTGKWEWTTDTNKDTAIKGYDKDKSSQYNYVDGFNNEVINSKHDYVIGANNTVTGDSYDDKAAKKYSNESNIIFGDNHTVTNTKNAVIIGSSDPQMTLDKGDNATAIGHNASAQRDALAVGVNTQARGNAVALGTYSTAHNNSIAIGTKATVVSSQNLAIGWEAHVGNIQTDDEKIKNAIALGSDSQVKVNDLLESDNNRGVLSIGDKDKERRIIHVRAGVNDTDAVNVSQLKSAQNDLTDKGLTFAANEGNDYTAKLGSKVTIQGTKKTEGHEYTADNLTTEIDKDGNITILMDKDMSTEKLTVNGKDGKDGKPGTAGSIGISGQDGKAGVGIDGKDGISIKGKDGKDGVTMKAIDGKNGTEGHIGLTGPAGTNGKDGTNAIDITVKNGYDDKDKGINGTNGVDGKDGITRIVYTDKTGEHQVATLEDGLKFKGDDTTVISKKLNNTLDIIGGADSKNLTDKNIGVNSTDKGQLKVQLAKDLKGITSISNQTTTKVDGKDVTTGAKITLGDDGSVDVNAGKITNVGSGIEKDGEGNITDASKTNAANIGDVQTIAENTATGLTDKGLKFAANSGAEYTAKLGSTVKIQGTKKKDGHEYTADNLTTEIDKDGNITILMDKDMSVEKLAVNGKDGKDGKPGTAGSIGISGQDGKAGVGIDGKDGISIKGKDGKDGVTMKAIDGKNGTEGHIGLTGPAGTNGKDGTNAIDITVKNGYDDKDKGINGTNGVDGKDGITRIVYTDKTGEHQVATLEDGLKFKGDDTTVISKKLNNTLDIIGGADSKNLTDKNIGVNSTTDGKLKVQLAKDLTGLNSTTYTTTTGEGSTTVVNGNGLTITNGPSITNNGVDAGNKTITNVGSGADASGKYTEATKSNAANIGDVQNIVNDAKKELTDGENGLNSKANVDASNIGTNLAADKQQDNLNKWGKAIGTGKIEQNNGQLVTGNTVYEYNKPIAKDGKSLNYVSEQNTTGQNLGALDSQVKNNADAIQKNSESIQNITNNVKNLSDNAVQYDKDSNKTKVTLGGEGGTTITHVKDGALSASSTDAVNGKQLYNEQQAREAADKAITEKVTNNTNEITKIKNGDFTDASKTAIHNIAKDAVKVVDGINTKAVKIEEGTDTTPTKYAVNVEGKGKVDSGDTGLISGDTLYKEVHVDKDGSYIKSSQTVGQNLSALDSGLKTTSDLIHTNDKGDTIQIGGNSTATKIDVSGKDANGNTTGRVITGVISDASNPNSAANVGYVNSVMNNTYGRLDRNINRAAAGSNALAALHPLDYDPADKASFAVGYGHYRNANAAAIGAFYYPNANTMVNVGVSVGNGDPGFNAGVSFKIGKGSTYNGVSKAEMAQTIHDQAEEIKTIKANDVTKDKRIDALEKENQEMKKQIQEILARLNG